MAEVIPFRSSRGGARKLPRWHFPGARRFRPILAVLAAGAVAGFAIWPRHESSAPKLAGFATIVDGDTIRIRGERIRLVGMDAPELHQTCRDASGRGWSCGRSARERLAALVAGSAVTCRPSGHDRYGRTLAICTSGAGADLGGTLVREGLAVAAYGNSYRVAELGARSSGRGLWGGEFERPQQWRKSHQHYSGR
jgi:endonuclease YncB( thermonuclease family)